MLYSLFIIIALLSAAALMQYESLIADAMVLYLMLASMTAMLFTPVVGFKAPNYKFAVWYGLPVLYNEQEDTAEFVFLKISNPRLLFKVRLC